MQDRAHKGLNDGPWKKNLEQSYLISSYMLYGFPVSLQVFIISLSGREHLYKQNKTNEQNDCNMKWWLLA